MGVGAIIGVGVGVGVGVVCGIIEGGIQLKIAKDQANAMKEAQRREESRQIKAAAMTSRNSIIKAMKMASEGVSTLNMMKTALEEKSDAVRKGDTEYRLATAHTVAGKRKAEVGRYDYGKIEEKLN